MHFYNVFILHTQNSQNASILNTHNLRDFTVEIVVCILPTKAVIVLANGFYLKTHVH